MNRILAVLLLTEIRPEHISRYQRTRLKEKASSRSVNILVPPVRLVMRKHKLWLHICDDVRMLKERAAMLAGLFAPDEQQRLLKASVLVRLDLLSRDLLLSLHTGLRLSELRLLRWHQVDLYWPALCRLASRRRRGGKAELFLSAKRLPVPFKNGVAPSRMREPGHAVVP